MNKTFFSKTYIKLLCGLLGILPMLVSCNSKTEYQEVSSEETKDTHSFVPFQGAKMDHLDIDLKVDFDKKVLSGTAIIRIVNKHKKPEIVLDTKGLNITKITYEDGSEAKYELGEEVKYLGKALTIQIKPDTKTIKIAYSSSPDAAALQWLNPTQTNDKKHPFLFSQSQSILARTWIPCQDSPGIRFSYNAKLTVPKGLLALMSASNPTEKSADGVYTFEMKQPIPAYLLAIAVGDMEFEKIDDRTGVYAEPTMLEKSVKEMEDLGKMVGVAENLYGPYAWERYDILVLPSSFPFGGMENPRLTFATPTIIAGDKSLISLVAHELAHSWSGNLVTNHTWNDFWLNEGFTVYFERRIIEDLYGKDNAEMEALLGYQDLVESLEEMGKNNKDTKLYLDLQNRDPDEGVTNIAYEKGYFFLRMIEETIGREKFDTFLKAYFKQFSFKTMNTKAFITHLEKEIINGDKSLIKKINYKDWIYNPGLPSNCPKVVSDKFVKIDANIEKWVKTQSTDSLTMDSLSTQEWLHFVRHLPKDMTIDQMKQVDNAYHFTQSGNAEIQAAWYIHVINHQYTDGYESLEDFLVGMGRRKFLTPLYTAMSENKEEGKALAKKIYTKARPNYHFVSVTTIDQILKWKK